MFMTPFALYIAASVCAVFLAAALPFALWYYFRAKEIAPLLTKKAALETIIENLTKDIHQAREELDKLANDKVLAKQLITEGELARKWLEENKKLIDDLNVQVVRMKEEFEVSKTQLEDITQKVSTKQTELAELNTKLLTSEEKMAKLEKTHQENVAKLEQLQDELKKDVSRLGAEKAALQSEKESLGKLIDEMKSEGDKLKKESDALRKEIMENRALKEANERLSRDNSKASLELDELRQKAEAAKINIARSEAIKNNEANMWKDLERPVAPIKEKPLGAKPVTDEGTALTMFKKGLDESGYAFNERTIKAFHTGLLCGGVSPLVVLSGISGTGKSLLPELYANAFGMNFMPVAVQPRWDGPQDVFGFYNHMEGRFKATELSRLLWQFDQFNNPKAKEEYPKENWDNFPMSLVLLDEMNLARIEYYFSELLSKLEIRNRVFNPNDNKARIASEVELEYGASSVTNARVAETMARRLFVGTNILFVGTMNEDESTQTLSSKVIDRSNVLRFGTPESLTRPPDQKRFLDFCKNFVSYKTWLGWAKPYGAMMPDIDEYIRELEISNLPFIFSKSPNLKGECKCELQSFRKTKFQSQ